MTIMSVREYKFEGTYKKQLMVMESFIEAVNEGNLQQVRCLLNTKSVAVDAQDRWGDPMISIACRSGHFAIVQELAERGADLSMRGEVSGYSPLHEACKWGDVRILQLLIDKGANIHMKANIAAPVTPLDLAVEFANIECVSLLLRLGAKVSSWQGNELLRIACQYAMADKYTATRLIILLLNYRFCPNARLSNTYTPFTYAIKFCPHLVEEFICRGADVEEPYFCDTFTSGRPLHFAAFYGLDKVVKLLRDARAETTVKDIHGKTPLELAMQQLGDIQKKGSYTQADLDMIQQWKAIIVLLSPSKG